MGFLGSSVLAFRIGVVEAGFPFMLVKVLGFLSVSGLEDDEAAMLAGFDLGMYVSISVSTPVVLIIFVVQIEDAEYSIPLLLMALYKQTGKR